MFQNRLVDTLPGILDDMSYENAVWGDTAPRAEWLSACLCTLTPAAITL